MTELKEICKVQCGFAFDSKKFTEDDSFSPLIRIRDVKRGFTQTYYTGEFSSEYIVHKGDLLVGMDGEFNIARWNSDDALLNQRVCRIIANNNVNGEYLRFYLKRTLKLIESKTSFVTVKHLSAKELNGLRLDLPSMEVQQRISKQLSMLEAMIRKNKKALELLDELVKARFVEMFGNPVLNEKGWITKPLIDMGNCKNGMNFHYNENGCEVKCLGVGDFKDLSIINNIESLQTVSLNEMPSEEYMLRDNDIVFVRSNGNKALVGRSVVIYPGDMPTTFSGFCIRFRKYDDSIIVPYLLHVLKTDSFRSKMVGRGANIQNLNQQILASLIIPVPPLELQNQFASFVQEIDKSRLLNICLKSLMEFVLKFRIFSEYKKSS